MRGIYPFILLLVAVRCQNETTDLEAEEFLDEINEPYNMAMNAMMIKRWAYITDVRPETEQDMIVANGEFQAHQKNVSDEIELRFGDLSSVSSNITRELKFLKIIGNGALNGEDQDRINIILATMESTYGTAKICPYSGSPDPAEGCEATMNLDDISLRMTKSTDYHELIYMWKQWRAVAGKPIKDHYTEFVNLSNKAASEQGFNDTGKLWNEYYLYHEYSEDMFKEEIGRLWDEIKPLYEQLYTYVRRVLNDKLYDDEMLLFAPMPAHIFGNMWAQSWVNIADYVMFFGNVSSVDATPGMIEKGWTVDDLFRTSQEFFVDLGFDNMTATFWEKSLFERPEDREVQCHASAEDFYSKDDFRIKMCTYVNHEDFITVHHEMGHIAYFMEYENQRYIFRNGANPGFHEAIGDCIALAVSTPAHLRGLGLIEDEENKIPFPLIKGLPQLPEDVNHQEMNYLLRMALDKIPFLPFAVAMDKWRWKVFDGSINPTEYNGEWWRLVEELQGLLSPTEPQPDDFDPGAKYHIPANVEYIRYFVSFILQFQFYDEMCSASHHTGHLFRCDFNGNLDAGTKLRTMMQKGMSQPWNEALQDMIGNGTMSAASLLKYFAPLHKYLEEINEANDERCIGWECDYEDIAREYMAETYESEMNDKCSSAGKADWNYNTDINSDNEQLSIEASLEFSAYEKHTWDNFITEFDYENFKNETLKRQFKLKSVLGVAALDKIKLEALNKVQSNLKNIYSTGKICPYNEKECDLITSGIPLEGEPGETSIEDILESSQNYDELAYVWEAWRDATGKKMFDYFVSYVSLSNDAAQANGLENYGDLWMMPYDMADEFKNQIEKILNQTMPLYEKIHAYARKKLLEKYTGKFAAKDLIPASLFGNMWAQSWEALYPIVAPYPELPGLDVTDNMVANNWTVEKMFEVSENFYVNLTLEEMPTTYNTSLSMIVKPPNKEVTCHASAWEFCKEEDYRIKMCTGVNMQDLITVHHEMGHIQYFQQYRHALQPYAFREGANPGFHEAVGDLMALSVQTPGHLKKIGLLEEDFTEDERSDLNFLMLTALSKIVFLPFAYVMDRWRWDIFAGQVEQEQWNKHWWDLRATYQGIMPPVLRTNQDLDAGAKYHTAANVEYSRYFVAHILQFQLHKSLCEIAGQFDENDPNKPLYRCDIDGNAEAGEKIRRLLAAGSSIPWPNLLESIIGERELNASAILLYFKPLSVWLDEQLTDDDIGWDPSRVDDWFLPKEFGSDDTVAIIVGSVIAALVLLTLVGYFVGRSRAEKKVKRENEMREAQDYAENNDAYLSDGNNASL